MISEEIAEHMGMALQIIAVVQQAITVFGQLFRNITDAVLGRPSKFWREVVSLIIEMPNAHMKRKYLGVRSSSQSADLSY